MKKVNIKVRIVNDSKEETITDVLGDYDEENNIISYIDGKSVVRVIINEKIVFEKSNFDYNLKLIFEDGHRHLSTYDINNPKMTLEVEVDTVKLQRSENGFYIEYILKLNNENNGTFSIDFKWEE